ncbi:MAG: hypothetical protein ACKVHH_02580 [Candidatus Poseidoniales archaeon]
MGRRIAVLTVWEQRLLESLEAGLKGGDTSERRQFHATRNAAWDLLPKPWKGLCLVALRKEQPPEEDNKSSTSPIRKKRTGSSRRMDRGRGGRTANQDLLPSKDDILSDENESHTFKFATLLIHKARDRESWSDEEEAVLVGLRLECSQGVHKVWGKMAEESPLLAELAACPVVEITGEKDGDVGVWAEAARIDPRDNDLLSTFLEMELPFPISPEVEVDLKRAIIQVKKGKGKLNKLLTRNLRNLEGPACLISGLLAIASGDDSTVDILSQEISDDISLVMADQTLLYNLRVGNSDGWKLALSKEGTDLLTTALRTAAWLVAPMDEMDLSLSEMETGLLLLNEFKGDGTSSDGLRWHIVSALAGAGKEEEAASHLLELNINRTDILNIAIDVVLKVKSSEVFDWLESQFQRLDDFSLSQIVGTEGFPASLKLKAASLMDNSTGNTEVRSDLLELMITTDDISGLAKLLQSIDEGPSKYPLEALLACHLHPATGDEELIKWLHNARKIALNSIGDSNSAPGISNLSFSLLNMLDGGRCQLDPMADRLDMAGFQAFKECRRALAEDGDGLVSESNLKRLEESVSQAELIQVERSLFETLIDGLRLNRAAMLLQESSASNDEMQLLNEILSTANPKLAVVIAAREMVMEHDIPLPSLVDWYQRAAPTSVWSLIVKAAVQSAEGDRLASARSWRLAADRSTFSYEERVMLYRKALIHFAHSETWAEAVELLDREQALHPALTKRFQLYLRVSNDAHRKQQEAGTRRLMDFVRSDKKVMVENQDGEIIEETKNIFAEDELDFLFNYHNEHPIPLPPEPFQGRVRAALSLIRKDRRRSRVEDEMRYQRLMHESSDDRDLEPLISDIYELATEAADDDAVRGLSILERAMNSGRFKPRQLKRLVNAQQGVYQNHHKEITVRQRKYLRHLQLTPLVFIDTNILVDSLKEKIASNLDLSNDVKLDLLGHRHFHKAIWQRKEKGMIRIFMPTIVSGEIRNITSDISRVRRMFSDVLVSDEHWNEVVSEEKLQKMVDELVDSFKDWQHPNIRFEEESEDYREELNQFLSDHEEVYDHLTQQKSMHGKLIRTALIEDDEIYPEEGDLKIMLQARSLAESHLDGIGSILIASRDGDFTLFARAFEERFGFGVVKNAQQLKSWLR